MCFVYFCDARHSHSVYIHFILFFSSFLQVKTTAPKGLAPPLDPNDPFADDEKERREVEELARKFENKYVSSIDLRLCLFIQRILLRSPY